MIDAMLELRDDITLILMPRATPALRHAADATDADTRMLRATPSDAASPAMPRRRCRHYDIDVICQHILITLMPPPPYADAMPLLPALPMMLMLPLHARCQDDAMAMPAIQRAATRGKMIRR